MLLSSQMVVPPAESAGRSSRSHGRLAPRWRFPYGLDTAPVIAPMPSLIYGSPPEFDFEDEPPFVPGPSPAPEMAPSLPQGFVLDVPITPTDRPEPVERDDEQITRYREVADALAQCWRPPATFADRPWRQVTLRVSFKRDGSINGLPRIAYMDQGLTPAARSDLRQSLIAALRSCVPLPFSPSLGGAVAGQIFALRFIEQDQD